MHDCKFSDERFDVNYHQLFWQMTKTGNILLVYIYNPIHWTQDNCQEAVLKYQYMSRLLPQSQMVTLQTT